MDGLECSEILLSRVKKQSTLRFDPEYYKKSYLKIEDFIEQNAHRFISMDDLSLSVDASAFYPSLEPYYNLGSIPFIRVADVKDTIDYDNCVSIPQMGDEFKTLHKCRRGDIVLTKGGRVGTAGLITKDSYVTRDLIFIDSSKLDEENNILLYLYFCSDFVYQQMLRSSSMTAQPHLTITLIREIPIISFSAEFKQYISTLYNIYNDSFLKSKSLYKEAERLLKKELNIEIIEQSLPVYSKMSFSDSFLKTGRLDAEYYQPKYEQLERELVTTEIVDSLCNLYDSNYIPEDEKFYKYIELANVGKSGEISSVESVKGKSLPTRARRVVKNGQIIVSSIEGSLGSCALITEEYNNSLCSTGFYVIDSTVINSETLLVLFKSEVLQALLKRRCSGTILTAISKEEFLNMPLPEVGDSIQKEIAAKVQESFVLRKKSKDLLEYAKKAVEMAIEQGEKTAVAWLKSKELINGE